MLNSLLACIIACRVLSGANSPLSSGDPVAPVKPLLMMTEVGAVASSADKVSLNVTAVIDRDRVVVNLSLKEEGVLGGRLTIPQDELPWLREQVATAADAASRRTPFTAERGELRVSAVQEASESGVEIRVKQEGFALTSDRFTLDPDNAQNFVRLIQRAEDVIVWLEPRLQHLKF